MVAARFTQQLPLSSYSMFSIQHGKENEFSPPFDSLLRAAALPREVGSQAKQRSLGWRGGSAAAGAVESGSCPLPPVAEAKLPSIPLQVRALTTAIPLSLQTHRTGVFRTTLHQ